MNRAKIAFISEHASPLATPGSVDSGGQNIYVSELAKELVERGYDVDIFTRKDDERLPTVIQWMPNIRVVHVTAGPQAKIAKEELFQYMDAFFLFMWQFIKQQQLQYELLHAHFWMSGWVAAKLKKTLDIPFVITFHALGAVRLRHQKEADGFPKERIDIEKEIVHCADKVVAECPQDAEDLKSYYGAADAKITIIPCGFSKKEFFPIAKKRARKVLGLDPKEKIILQLGRMVPRKGIDNVIQVIKHLAVDATVYVLIVGGEKQGWRTCPEYQRLKAIADQTGEADKITFVGSKERKALKYYYAAADIFVSTPWYEPFGITPLEAMACGIPVVGSEVGGIKYSVTDGVTGFLVPPKNPKALAQKLREILQNDKLKEKMGRAALKKVNSLFTWERVGKKMAKIYQHIIHPETAEQVKTISLLNQQLYFKVNAISKNAAKSNLLG